MNMGTLLQYHPFLGSQASGFLVNWLQLTCPRCLGILYVGISCFMQWLCSWKSACISKMNKLKIKWTPTKPAEHMPGFTRLFWKLSHVIRCQYFYSVLFRKCVNQIHAKQEVSVLQAPASPGRAGKDLGELLPLCVDHRWSMRHWVVCKVSGKKNHFWSLSAFCWVSTPRTDLQRG